MIFTVIITDRRPQCTQVSCKEQELKGYPFGLNEIAVLKRDSSSMISIHTAINGAYLTTYQADGLVIATPPVRPHIH